MELMTLRIFQREVAQQCRFATLSVDAINTANHERDEMFEKMRAGERTGADFDGNGLRTWFALQAFLVATANISKLLWGSKQGEKPIVKQRQHDRRELRASLGVMENSVLRLSPEFRNHFEHLDERIEEWAADSTHHNHADDTIGPANMIVGIDPGDMFRSYDPSTHILTFRGEAFDIPSVAHAVGNLMVIAEREAAKPHWEPPGQSASAGGGGQ